jgi:Arc/MetJ family transcription regulator
VSPVRVRVSPFFAELRYARCNTVTGVCAASRNEEPTGITAGSISDEFVSNPSRPRTELDRDISVGQRITGWVSKHFVDIDEDALRAARARLGTGTIKDTVNGALRRASGEHGGAVKQSLDLLARADLAGREEPWR